jgi:hypothetical protein
MKFILLIKGEKKMMADYQEQIMDFDNIWMQARQTAYAELANLRQQAKSSVCKCYRKFGIFGSTIVNSLIIFLVIF